MPITSHKLGPGVFTIGAGPLDISAQVTECTVAWEESVKTTEAIDTLDGSQIPEEEEASYKAKVTITVLQDNLAAAGMIDYSWTNKGVSAAFKFIPNNSISRKITGTVRIVPIDIGGTVKTRNTSSVTWNCVITGQPVLGATP